MLTSPDPLAVSEYQRSVVVSVLALLDGFAALVPANPASFVWEGAAQRAYVDELGRLRDDLWQLQSTLQHSLSSIGVCRA